MMINTTLFRCTSMVYIYLIRYYLCVGFQSFDTELTTTIVEKGDDIIHLVVSYKVIKN